jgi:DNA-directed DNA polymerase III PolC
MNRHCPSASPACGTRPRAIVHLDADAFFASVEQAADARLRGRPVAVGGEKRGIIASASYEARKFGIYTPMPTVQARRLCPRLVLLPGDFEKYELFSRLMFSYAYDFTPDVEIGSIDEGYFDLTGARQPAPDIAGNIRNAIRQALRLSVSEGVATNKLVSQIASKLKKPSAFELVSPGGEAEFLSPLANQWLPGVGPKLAVQLNAAGLARIGQMAATPPDLLSMVAGSLGPQLHRFARGLDERPVVPACEPARSFGEQETFPADTTDELFLEATLRRMADKLMAKVRGECKSVRTLAVKVRYNDMDEEQASESLAEPTDLETEIYGKASALLRRAWRRRVSLRLVSLRLTNLYDGRFSGGLGLDVSSRRHEAQQRLADVVDQLREKHGRSVVMRGHDFVLRDKDNRGEEVVASSRSVNSGSRRRESALINSRDERAGGSSADLAGQGTTAPVERMTRTNVRGYGKGGADCSSMRVATVAPAGRCEMARANVRGCGKRVEAPIPLNVHSYYSFLDSTLSVESIVDWAKRHELSAIALTDRNSLHGAVAFAQAAAEAGIKPIIGAEVDCQGRRLCLYVENQKGYANLCRILNAVAPERRDEPVAPQAARRRPGARPSPAAASSPMPLATRASLRSKTIALRHDREHDWEQLLSSTDGLLALGPDPALARFFPDRFYLEARSLDGWEKHSAMRLPGIASFPVHYATPEDRWKYNIVQSIRTLTLLRQAHPEKRLAGEYHFRSMAELGELFAAHPEWLAHSRELAERCSFAFTLGQPQFPSYPPTDGLPPAEFLRRLALGGLRRRYPKEHTCLQAQLEEELAIITDVGYEEYFLVMWDILQECRRRDIEWITRGSAADSLVCYCLEISGVCPIRFDLYFRRFLNKDRMALNKLPDIDVDFPHDRKDDVVDLIFEKYGPARAAVVGGFSTFQARSAFAEVAKVLGVSDHQARRITERLPQFGRVGHLVGEEAIRSLEFRDLPLAEEPYRTALEMAQFLDGFPRYAKMHPCGVVLSRQPMSEITPCFTSAKGYPTTHFDMDSVEAVGLVKMDILAQGGLAVMRDVKGMVEGDNPPTAPQATSSPTLSNVAHAFDKVGDEVGDKVLKSETLRQAAAAPPPIDLPALEPWTDPAVWELIASGQARAVHHIESPAMISLCRMCNVRDIDTLIAIVSVIRPGAANENKKQEFARRYQGTSPVQYPHPSLAACLRSTYGLVVYEEHILQICEAFAGLPPGRADVLRRALGKEKTAVIAQIQTEFAECARRQGRAETDIAAVWELVAGFRGYAFCKAHSTAYGVEAYQAAWLKLHYPAEFMAAVLTNGKGFYSPLVYVLECHRLGTPLLPPCVNEPGPHFSVVTSESCNSVTQKKIRVPVTQVKGLTLRTREAILHERARSRFASLHDFYLRVQPLPEEMEALIRVGAFDRFGQARTTQYWEFKALCRSVEIPSAARRAATAPAAPVAHQLWLLPPENLDRLPAVPLAEPTRLERLRWEEESLGYPASGHPLELFPDIAWDTYCPVRDLGRYIGEEIVTCGLVIEQRLFHQITGEPMKFVTIADRTGIVETELFARTYKSYGLNTIRYRVLEVTATVEAFDNHRGYTLRVLRAGGPRERKSIM